jgi:hypothetical protein
MKHSIRTRCLFSALLLVTCSFLRLITEMISPINRRFLKDGGKLDVMENLAAIEQIPRIHPNAAMKRNIDIQRQSVHCQDMGFTNKSATTEQKPVILAGYPGSGNDLSRTIVERLTGFDGNDIYTSDGNCSAWQRAATCKTHFPMNGDYPIDSIRDSFAPSAALLIRNPANAIHSLYNYFWELDHNVTDHSQQGPEGEWITWRDEQFDYQIEQWSKLLVYWFDHWDVQTLLPYEQLTHPETGPLLVQQLALHLEFSGFSTATDYECQWYDCVVQSARVKRAPHRYAPSYTLTQKRKMLQAVKQSLVRFSDHSALAPLLHQYTIAIQNVRVVG